MASNYSKPLYNDYEKLITSNEKLTKENKSLLLRATIAEDEQRRLENIVEKKTDENEALQNEINNLKKETLCTRICVIIIITIYCIIV